MLFSYANACARPWNRYVPGWRKERFRTACHPSHGLGLGFAIGQQSSTQGGIAERQDAAR